MSARKRSKACRLPDALIQKPQLSFVLIQTPQLGFFRNVQLQLRNSVKKQGGTRGSQSKTKSQGEVKDYGNALKH